MKKRNKILASLMVSSQLLGAIVPVMAETEIEYSEDVIGEEIGRGVTVNHLTSNYEGEPVKPTDGEKAEKYIFDGEYSSELKAALDELYIRAQNMDTYGDLDTLIEDYTSILEHVHTTDAAHNIADSQLLGIGESFKIHELIRNQIYRLGGNGSTRLINYGNKLVMAMTKGAFGFENQVADLYLTHQIFAAQDEMYRLQGYTTLFMDTLKDDGVALEYEIVAGRLVYPVYEDLGIDMKRPEEPVMGSDDTGDRDLTGDLISGDDDLYPQNNMAQKEANLGKRTGTYYEYDEVNGRRYLVRYTIETVDGKEKKTETRTVDASGLTSMWSDRFSGSTANYTSERLDVNIVEKKKNRLTLQYSLNKDSQFPNYIDTGLFTDEDGNADYKSLYDTLYQIAVNIEGGYLVEDTDKLLVIVEGRPIYIMESQESYTKSEIETIFNDFKTIDLIVSETRIGTTNSLEWQLRTGQKQNVVVDGEQLELKNEPSIRGERVVLPIVEIMEAVGADVTEGGDIITVRYNDITVTFESGVSQARVNGNLTNLDVPVIADDKGTKTANLTPIFKALSIEAVWDEEASSLYLDNTNRPAKETQEDDIAEDEEVETEQE